MNKWPLVVLLVVAAVLIAFLLVDRPEAVDQKYEICGEGGTDVNVEYWIDTDSIHLEVANCVTPPNTDDSTGPGTTALMDGGSYAWRQFLYLTSKGGDGRYRLTKFGDSDDLFPETGSPPPWKEASESNLTFGPTGKHSGFTGVLQAASMVPVVDENGRWLHYTVAVNGDEWKYIRGDGLYTKAAYNKQGCSPIQGIPGLEKDYENCLKGEETCLALPGGQNTCAQIPAGKDFAITLPETAIELKASWRVLETCDLPDSPEPCKVEDASPFVTIKATVDPYGPGKLNDEQKNVTLGLVGLHILSKTPVQPDWVWATFEHTENTDNCPSPPWHTDKTIAPSPYLNKFCPPEPIPIDVSASFKKAVEGDPNNPKDEGDTTKIVSDGKLQCTGDPQRYFAAKPHLYEPALTTLLKPTEICRLDAIAAPVASLNKSIQDKLGKDSNLKNYELVGVFWFKKPCRKDPAACTDPIGTPRLANTTAETYLQEITCTVCHGINQFNPNPFGERTIAAGLADRSFIFQRIRQDGGSEPSELDAP